MALHNRALKDRHWNKVFDAIGTQLIRDGTFTLQVLLDAKVQEFKDSIVQISTEATQELALEELLAKVQSKWVDIDFVILPYKEVKDCYILGGIEDVQVGPGPHTLDPLPSPKPEMQIGPLGRPGGLHGDNVNHHGLKVCLWHQGRSGESREEPREHSTCFHLTDPLPHPLLFLVTQQTLFADTLDEWIAVQKAWMYLEPIFSSQDIQKQLPVEAKAFVQADKQIKEIMRKTKERPNALLAGIVPGLLEIFQRANETLEGIQKNLEDYLETKRIGFPR